MYVCICACMRGFVHAPVRTRECASPACISSALETFSGVGLHFRPTLLILKLWCFCCCWSMAACCMQAHCRAPAWGSLHLSCSSFALMLLSWRSLIPHGRHGSAQSPNGAWCCSQAQKCPRRSQGGTLSASQPQTFPRRNPDITEGSPRRSQGGTLSASQG
jgi:hypothetical protein